MRSDSRQLGDAINVSGSVLLQAWDTRGRRLRHVRKSNLITTRGTIVMARTISETGTGVTHVATGNDNTAPSISDTALGTETYRDQVTQYQRPGDGSVTFRLFIGAASANGTVIKEAGLLNASSGGELVARVAFSASEEITKTSDITAQISWTITFS